MNGTAPLAIEASPKATPEPDNRSVEDILAFLGEDSKSSASNGKKAKGKKGKAAKEISKDSNGSAKSTPSKPAKTSGSDDSTDALIEITPASPVTTPASNGAKETKIQVQAADARPASQQPHLPVSPTSIASKIEVASISKSSEPEVATLNPKSKTLNISASSSSSASSSTSTSSTNTHASVACDECAQELCACGPRHEQQEAPPAPSNILSGSMLTHLTFPSPFSAPTPAAAPTVGSPALPPGLNTYMMQHMATSAATTAAPPTMVYQPLTNFFPDPFAAVASAASASVVSHPRGGAPPGLDLPPGLSVNRQSPIRSPSSSAIAPPPGILQTSTELSSSASILDLDSTFANETSSCPVFTPSSSAQYYWGAPEEDDILKTSQDGLDDPDFELELAEFRQSLELGLRSSGNTMQHNLHSSGNHSSQSGNKPVGAY